MRDQVAKSIEFHVDQAISGRKSRYFTPAGSVKTPFSAHGGSQNTGAETNILQSRLRRIR
ncbi:hypothetical protein CFter6_4649 [Collimonas fungivorans]|uniref:Uncharacterized protein n=1 Tax=Collimonas fungivorans TaxID=158899 RepID=A0A127PHF0_9BURK|nr:hypothetical protein CFter6_4649 [Collimonas fungivorans]